MNKHPWQKAWEDKRFSIETLTPSILVSGYEKLLNNSDSVLDIGCGNGRNSIYLANKGYKVDCFDVVDVRWKEKLSVKTQQNISFKKDTILEYPYKISGYQVIIVTRVIQYLNPEELSFLFEKIKDALKPNGFLLLSYNTKGGIFNRKEIGVSTYSYKIEYIEDLLKKIFRNVKISTGSKKNQHVNYVDDILTFDIFASDPSEPTR